MLAVKWVAALAILIGVAAYFTRTLQKSELSDTNYTLRVEYLIPAGLLYLLAHCCWGSFWVRLLRFEGIPATWFVGMRAYFVSQLGKYVPGKVWVIVMRVAMLRPAGGRPLPVAVTATYETLTNMASGVLLGVALLPWLGVLPAMVSANWVVLIGVAALPLVLGVLNKFVVRIAEKTRRPDAPPLPAPSLFLLAQGLLHGACGWCLLGISLGFTIRAIVPDPGPWTLEGYAGDTSANALSYVLGFVVVVAPGGVGVREYVLQVLLTPRFTPELGEATAGGLAVVIALVLRLTWTVAELVAAGLLWLRKPATVESPPALAEARHA